MKPASAEEKKLLIPTLSESDIVGFEALGQERSVPAGTIIQDRDLVVSGVLIVLQGSVDLLGTANREEAVHGTFER